MKIKFNWGFGIIAIFILFFITLGIMAFISFNNPSDLVTNSYYDKELKYQDEIDKMNNTAQLKNKPVIEKKDNGIFIFFPDSFDFRKIKGKVKMYKPSDMKGDFEENLSLDEHGTMLIPLNMFTKGVYKTQLNWSLDGKNFYDERSFIFQ
jgi:hypothetical protein